MSEMVMRLRSGGMGLGHRRRAGKRKSYITLKCLALIEGEDQDHILASFECLREERAIFDLRRPD